MEPPHQLDLFAQTNFTKALRPNMLQMGADALVRWKCQIAEYQGRIRNSQPEQQATLFDLAPAHCDPYAIDPFTLLLCPMSFYRLPADSPGKACLYFIIDSAANILLYVGETCRSNLRWKGEHDCKRYIDSYQSLHYQHGVLTAVNMSFWWDAPSKTKPRQQLESALILRWRTPFVGK